MSSVVTSFFKGSIPEIGYFDYKWDDGTGATLDNDTVHGDSRVCGTGESLAFQF